MHPRKKRKRPGVERSKLRPADKQFRVASENSKAGDGNDRETI